VQWLRIIACYAIEGEWEIHSEKKMAQNNSTYTTRNNKVGVSDSFRLMNIPTAATPLTTLLPNKLLSTLIGRKPLPLASGRTANL